ncbi:MAG TPA: 16S rRNA (adenine(1518)-N(6)/adenine(1519)-N(6))-dimethyltransferase RsmA [Bacteroidales bacterium]|nr:16S rRNA (adenine(1518)-N(6)/adenine(1519)-N(6))-dimethyltransferase RsmA [Bacteroidales bacterium]
MSQPVRPKKKLGQHFLKDHNIARKIAESLTGFGGYRNILEIGPGTGVLTKFLLAKEGIVWHGIELDHESVAYLGEHFPEIAGRLVQADFLTDPLIRFADGEQLGVIGNFPYNISSQIVFKIIENRQMIPEMVGMFQKEMAQRIAAPHGGKTYGIISVLTQAFYRVEYLFQVDEQVFHPPPKVKSAVIRLIRKEEPLPCDQVKLFGVVKAAFNQRRKTLRNSLKGIDLEWESLPEGFSGLRPEQINLEGFFRLANSFRTK